MTRPTRREIEREIEELKEDENGESQLELWCRFLEGDIDFEDPHPQIKQWLEAGSDPTDTPGIENNLLTTSYTVAPGETEIE